MGEGSNIKNLNAGSSTVEKPPMIRSTQHLQTNNINKLKMKDKLKKLKMTKQEIAQVVKEIEFERIKISELKHSIFGDIRKV